MKRRRIGGLYDKEKFHAAFEAAANAFVSRVMDGFADSEKGRETYRNLLASLKKQIADVPTEYYRVLETYIDGGDVLDQLQFHRSPDDLKYFKDKGPCGIIELLNAYKDGSWTVIDPAAAEKYYESLFPSAVRRQESIKDIKEARASARIEAKARVRKFDEEARKICDERASALESINLEHAAFIGEKNIDKKDPAYGLLNGLYAEFKKEHKSLGRLEDLVMGIKRKLIPYEVLKERGVINERELEEHDLLKAKEKMATMDMECYMNALDELGEVRYRNGIISERLYLLMSQDALEKSTRPHPEKEKEASDGVKLQLSLGKKTTHERTAEREESKEKQIEDPGLEK